VGDNGESTEREIPFMKGYTVFNAEQYNRRIRPEPSSSFVNQ
jgi:antirestriction protein ArdC